MDEHDLAVINESLAELGIDPIQDLEQDKSSAALFMRARYPTIRDSSLGREGWSFARKRVPLTLVTDRGAGADEPWRYLYRRPKDMVTPGPTNVVSQGDIAAIGAVDFDLEISDTGETYIVSNEENAYAIYNSRVNAQQFSPAFREFLVLRLAEAACVPLTGDEDHRRVIRSQMYPSNRNAVGAWSNLLNSDADSRPPGTFNTNPFVFGRRRSRLGGF